MSAAAVRAPKHNPQAAEICQRLKCVRGAMDHLPTSPFVRAVILPLLRRRVKNLNAARMITTTKRVRG